MLSIGLVLGAGGAVGDPWHCGVLSRLGEVTGWDARDADLIIGTSAGAFSAVSLRCGVSAAQRVAHFRGEPLSKQATEVYNRITTPYDEPLIDQSWRDRQPLSAAMSARALMPPWQFDPARFAIGLLPRQRRSNLASKARMNELHPQRWPKLATWIVAVRAHDGRRVVFGRDDVAGSIGEAVQASSAVPSVYAPAKIGELEYIDGGVHSATNADLAAGLGFDLVIVSSPLTGVSNFRSSPVRSWFTKKLRAELAALQRLGTSVAVIEPAHGVVGAAGAAGASGAAGAADAADSSNGGDTNSHLSGVRAGELAVDRFMKSLPGVGLKTVLSHNIDG